MTDLQRTREWFAERCGKITASRVHDLTVKRTDGAWGASRVNYIAELVAERLTGAPVERFTNAAMERGSLVEPEAKAAYTFRTDRGIEDVGFVKHPDIANAGASPDGLVGADGLIEVKCPNTATHIATLLGAAIDAEYLDQMQWQLACTRRQWCDFVSYDPRMPPVMALFIKRVARDDKRIAELEAVVMEANREIHATVERLRSLYEPEEPFVHPIMAG